MCLNSLDEEVHREFLSRSMMVTYLDCLFGFAKLGFDKLVFLLTFAFVSFLDYLKDDKTKKQSFRHLQSLRVIHRTRMHERDTEKEKQNGRKGPRVMGLIMYASCRAGSSSSVGTKPFRKSLLFQKSFETFTALVRLSCFHTASRCRSVHICFFV